MNQKNILYITIKNNKFEINLLFFITFFKKEENICREPVGYDIRIDTASIKSFKIYENIHLYKLI